MKRFSYFLITLIVLPCLVFVACDDNSSSDKEKPTIEYARLNSNDTLKINKNSGYLYNEDKSYYKEDTIIMGQDIKLSAHFIDNEGLSSYFIRIDSEWEDATKDDWNAASVDTFFSLKKVGPKSIFGATDTVIKRVVLLTQIPETLLRGTGGNAKKLPIKEGKYRLSIECVDVAGNYDNSSIYRVPIYLISDKKFKEVKDPINFE